jgi:nucleoid DNA-binding protein
MQLPSRILHLLRTHDCVVVPGFGALLVNYRAARVDEGRKLVYPPTKDLGFNRQITRNDGLLIDHVADSTRSTMALAETRVRGWVDSLLADLARTGRAEMEGLGVFFHDVHGALQFEPDRHVTVFKDAYGLRPLTAVPLPVKETQQQQQIPRVAGPRSISTGRADNGMVAAATSAAAVALIAWLVVRSTIPIGGSQLSGFFPWARALEAPRTAAVPTARVDKLVVPPTQEKPVIIVPIAPMDSTRTAVPTVVLDFHVIAGCFRERGNAERKLIALREQGFNARLLDEHKGLFRISAGAHATLQEAQAAQKELLAKGEAGVWVLRR